MAKPHNAENTAPGFEAVEALLGVSQDSHGHWAAVKAEPSEESRVQSADLDALMSHLHSAFTPAQAVLWLQGPEPHLDARPIDVFRLEGPAPLIAAIRSYEQGAFA